MVIIVGVVFKSLVTAFTYGPTERTCHRDYPWNAVERRTASALVWTRVSAGHRLKLFPRTIPKAPGQPVLFGILSNGNHGGVRSIVHLRGSETTLTKDYSLDVSWAYPGPVIKLADGGYMAITSTPVSKKRTLLEAVRFNAEMRVVWRRKLGTNPYEHLGAVVEMPDRGFAIAGSTRPHGWTTNDVVVIRLSPTGHVVWRRTYGGANQEYAGSIISLPDGDIVFAGSTNSKGPGRSNAWVVRLGKTGQVVWERAIGTRDYSSADRAKEITALSDGSLAIVGTTGDMGISIKAQVIRMSSKDKILWTKSFRGDGWTNGRTVLAAKDGGLIVGGITMVRDINETEAWLVRFSADGSTRWCTAFRGIGDLSIDSIGWIDGESLLIAGSETSSRTRRRMLWLARVKAR